MRSLSVRQASEARSGVILCAEFGRQEAAPLQKYKDGISAAEYCSELQAGAELLGDWNE